MRYLIIVNYDSCYGFSVVANGREMWNTPMFRKLRKIVSMEYDYNGVKQKILALYEKRYDLIIYYENEEPHFIKK